MMVNPPNKGFSRAYRKFLYLLVGRRILLLTTTGRKTGRQHTIGLQYEFIDDKYWVAAADGVRADWYRNILKEPRVDLQVGRRIFPAIAIAESDPEKTVDFLEYRLTKHPFMMRAILRMDGFKGKIDRGALTRYAEKTRLVILTPMPPRA